MSHDCLGCKLANKNSEVYIVYEDDFVCCILDHDPVNEGHTLILPKTHVVEIEDLDSETLLAITKASVFITKSLKKLYRPDGISICQNGGQFNDLSHYHMHVIPRYLNQPFYVEEATKNVHIKDELKKTQKRLESQIKVVMNQTNLL